LALRGYFSSIRLHESSRDGEPEPYPSGFRGEQRLEKPLQVFGGHPDSGIDDVEPDESPISVTATEGDIRALAVQRLHRVGDEIEHDLSDLHAIDTNVGKVVREVVLDVDALEWTDALQLRNNS